MNHIVYHKTDSDGWCSAAIAIKYSREKGEPYKLWPANYGDFDELGLLKDSAAGDTIYVLDFFLCPDVAHHLSSTRGAKVVWIDHHKSAIERYDCVTKGHPEMEIPGTRDVGFAACELTWMYLYPSLAMPPLVRYLGVYDSWRAEDRRFKDAATLQHYARTSWMRNPEAVEWESGMWLTGENYQNFASLLEAGHRVEDAATIRWADSVKERGFVREIDGLRVLCLNSAERGSQLFEGLWDPKKHDIMMVFGFDGDHWNCSAYSTKDSVDCSEFAGKRGGGGHKGASGFRCDDIMPVLSGKV
jgi:oligoribonuclease NrnB/cAMP/cGMP phosphodiesterase (DHH superfamily)